MAGLFIQLDVEYYEDDKVILAGALGECLFVRSLAFAKRTLSDGAISRARLDRLALGVPQPTKVAARLVEVGLWTETNEGWTITAWSKRKHKTAAQLDNERETKRLAGELGNHKRHHIAKGVTAPDCRLCLADSSQGASDVSRTGLAQASPYTETETETESHTETETDPSSSLVTPPGADHAEDDGFIKKLAVAIAEHRAANKLRDPGARKRFIDTTVANLLRTEHDTLAAFLAGRPHMRDGSIDLAAQFYDAVRNTA